MTLLRKDRFELPKDLIYLDGNSLGPLPKGALERAERVLRDEWGELLIRAWNKAEWMDLPKKVGDLIAPLVGAPKGSIATGDTLSIKVYQALAAALQLNPDRKVILSDTGNFPTDLYMAQGLIRTIGKSHELRTVPPEEVERSINGDVAALMLTHVDYRSGRLHDMERITRAAQDAGAVMIWDLAHSAGALPVDLAGSGCEFAVGCTYKYLNGGPGAPAFIYCRPDLIEQIEPALSGWLGHEAPFEMEPAYRPALSTERLRIGTPSIVQLSILEEALAIWQDVDMQALRAQSIALGDLFIREVEKRVPHLELASPREGVNRGSQVSFAFSDGYSVVQALIERGVIGDFRAPNIMRFGFTPLYLDEADVLKAVEIIGEVFDHEIWRDPKYTVRSAVT